MCGNDETKNTTEKGSKATAPVQRLVIWLLLNFGMTACAYYGLIQYVGQATNILLFLAWSAAILITPCALAGSIKKELRAKGRAVPRWLAVGNDIIIMVALASVGRFFTAGAILWTVCCEAAIFEGED